MDDDPVFDFILELLHRIIGQWTVFCFALGNESVQILRDNLIAAREVGAPSLVRARFCLGNGQG